MIILPIGFRSKARSGPFNATTLSLIVVLAFLTTVLFPSLPALGGIFDHQASPPPGALKPLSNAKISPQGDLAFLPVDQAFKVNWTYDGKVLRGEFTIAPGCYLYQDRFKLNLLASSRTDSTLRLGALNFPSGEVLDDPFLGGTHTIYRQQVSISAPILSGHQNNPVPSQIEFEAIWQGCAEAGLCYPPVRKNFNILLSPP